MNYVYIAGPLFDDHERNYLESIAEIFETRGYKTFLPHRDAGVVSGEYTQEEKKKIFTTDLNALKQADIIVALLTGRDVDSGTAAEVGYAFANNKKLIGIGETGLDFYRNEENRINQIEYFNTHLEVSGLLNYPTIVHTRNAEKDTINCIEKAVK